MKDNSKVFEDAISRKPRYNFKLYIIKNNVQSEFAIENLKKLCEEYLAGNYSLEIIDVSDSPELAKEHQIIAVPTLIKELPFPLRKIVGDFSDKNKVLLGLGLNF